MDIAARARFAKAAEDTLIAIDNHHCHAGCAATVVNQVGVTIGNIRSESWGCKRLRSLSRRQNNRAQRSKGEQTTFQRKTSIK
jgi:hypothetical protein